MASLVKWTCILQLAIQSAKWQCNAQFSLNYSDEIFERKCNELHIILPCFFALFIEIAMHSHQNSAPSNSIRLHVTMLFICQNSTGNAICQSSHQGGSLVRTSLSR